MNELRVCLGRGRPHQGYTTVLANAQLGDYARFQPGPGIAMGYDDLKVTEARKFLVAVAGGERQNSSVDDALSVAEVLAAAERSAADGTWHKVPPTAGTTAARRV
jgi:predicted dehydrogenase